MSEGREGEMQISVGLFQGSSFCFHARDINDRALIRYLTSVAELSHPTPGIVAITIASLI